jgi:hypothetical protein
VTKSAILRATSSAVCPPSVSVWTAIGDWELGGIRLSSHPLTFGRKKG